MWGVGSSLSSPDGDGPLLRYYGPAKGESNLSAFDLADFNKLYLQQQFMPDGPERLAVLQKAVKLVVAYMPYKVSVHRILTDMSQSWCEGYLRHPVGLGFWQYMDINTSKTAEIVVLVSRLTCRHTKFWWVLQWPCWPGAVRRPLKKAVSQRRCSAMPSARLKPASIRHRSPTCIRAPSRATFLSRFTTFDYLARPSKVVPGVADGMPAITDNFKTYTVRIKRGIYFDDDPAFCDKDGKNCKKRELTAQDFVYSYKRIFDPKSRSPAVSGLEELKLVGLNALRQQADKADGMFDYDKEVEGLRALDRYTLQFKSEVPQPRLVYDMADPSIVGAVGARSGGKIWRQDHGAPGGHGAFQAGQMDALIQD